MAGEEAVVEVEGWEVFGRLDSGGCGRRVRRRKTGEGLTMAARATGGRLRVGKLGGDIKVGRDLNERRRKKKREKKRRKKKEMGREKGTRRVASAWGRASGGTNANKKKGNARGGRRVPGTDVGLGNDAHAPTVCRTEM